MGRRPVLLKGGGSGLSRWWFTADRWAEGAKMCPGVSRLGAWCDAQGVGGGLAMSAMAVDFSGSFRPMGLANSKKNAPLHAGFEWAGVVARVRRSGGSNRSGRRSALLGVLTSVYANSSRGARTNETRGASSTDRA